MGKQDDLNDLVQSTQTKLNDHAEYQKVSEMQTRVLDWIDTLPKLDVLAYQFMQTNDDVDQRKLLKKAKREARKIAHDDPDRSVAAHECVKVMDKMMKHKKAADKRRKEIKAETKNNGGSLIEGNEDEDVHVIDENDSKSPNQQKSAYLKRQIQRLERLVKSDGISEEKLR